MTCANCSPFARSPACSSRHRGERVPAGEEDAELERRRVGVVGRLRAVDVVVGVQVRVLPALVPEDLQGAVGDHLVDVHVGRGARAALDHVDDELVVKAPGGDLVAGLRDRVALVLAEHPEFGIGQCRGLLDESERVDETREVAQRDSGDREVLHGAQRLHAEVRAPGNLAVSRAGRVLCAAPAAAAKRSRRTTCPTAARHGRRVAGRRVPRHGSRPPGSAGGRDPLSRG